ncbi:hypothetical protein SNEBB_007709 [Seison nebaliae]|nr:hypothetical protein SNEBB_007709 [Seison nebaliae]
MFTTFIEDTRADKRKALLFFITVALGITAFALVIATLHVHGKFQVYHGYMNEETAALKQTFAKPPNNYKYCTTKGCLDSAVRMRDLLNDHVYPCDNFYKFACGKFAEMHPVVGRYSKKNPQSLLKKSLDKLLMSLLDKKVNRTSARSYEQKVKTVYQNCASDYDRSKTSVSVSSEFQLLDTPTTADRTFLVQLMADHHVKYKTDSFFDLGIKTLGKLSKKSLTLSRGKLGLSTFSYTLPSSYYSNRLNAYKKYIVGVIEKMQKDQFPNIDPDKNFQNTFRDDVIEVETALAKIYAGISYLTDVVPFTNLTTEIPIDIGLVLQQIFPLMDFGSNPLIGVQSYGALKKALAFFNQYATGTADQQRKLARFIKWHSFYQYKLDFGHDYVLIYRKFFDSITYSKKYVSNEQTCYKELKRMMPDALSRLYIAQHIGDINRGRIDVMIRQVRDELRKRVNGYSWMTQSERDFTIQKMEYMTESISYADYLKSDESIDQFYEEFDASSPVYYQNRIAYNQFKMKQTYKSLIGKNPLDDLTKTWTYYKPVDSQIMYSMYRNDLLVTAGILRPNIYSPESPQSVNFGSFVGLVSNQLIKIVNLAGSKYSPNGTYISKDPWTNTTMNNYNKGLSCYVNNVDGLTIGPYVYKNTDWYVKLNGGRAAPFLINEKGGLDLAYQAWNGYKQNALFDLPAPGFNTTDQMFFLAYTQAQCESRAEEGRYWNNMQQKTGRYTNDVMINLILRSSKEFVTAFNCPVGSQMNGLNRCKLF